MMPGDALQTVEDMHFMRLASTVSTVLRVRLVHHACSSLVPIPCIGYGDTLHELGQLG
jgi:hypothetical protein